MCNLYLAFGRTFLFLCKEALQPDHLHSQKSLIGLTFFPGIALAEAYIVFAAFIQRSTGNAEGCSFMYGLEDET